MSFKKDLLYTYMAGWRDGAGLKAINPARAEHNNKELSDEYFRGHIDGCDSRRRAAKAAQERLGVKFDVLRGVTGQDNE